MTSELFNLPNSALNGQSRKDERELQKSEYFDK